MNYYSMEKADKEAYNIYENTQGIQETKADAVFANSVNAGSNITEKLVGRRTKFVKQFAMSDESYITTTYSVLDHCKSNSK